MERRTNGTCFRARYDFVKSYRNVQRMAPAISGSIFNHSSNPNVSYILDSTRACIKFTTSRVVEPDEELSIYYGNSLWFQDAEPISTNNDLTLDHGISDMSGLENIDIESGKGCLSRLYLEEELPFERVNIADEEEEDTQVETGYVPFRSPAVQLVLIYSSRRMGR